MSNKIVIDPVTRIEGHLGIEVALEQSEIVDACCSGELFRGLELILQGRDPRDAQVITQRICGVCPQSHGIAAAQALDDAFGVEIPPNAQLIRNIIQGIHQIQDHILHFYHLALLDYLDITAVAEYDGGDPELNSVKAFLGRGQLHPFVPRYEGDYRLPRPLSLRLAGNYLKALEMRRRGHELVALWGGKIPHSVGVVPGGVTAQPTVDRIAETFWRFQELASFVEQTYLPDVLDVAGHYMDCFRYGHGCRNLLSYGAYPAVGGGQKLFVAGRTNAALEPLPFELEKVTEQVTRSWYEGEGRVRPDNGVTIPDADKETAYSWIKAPRYDGEVYEVGPLARLLVSYAHGSPQVKSVVDEGLSQLGLSVGDLFSVMGRHVARALCAKVIADAVPGWLQALDPTGPWFADYDIPQEGRGVGLTEAARGALAHFIRIEGSVIADYQCVVPTTWNASPKDADGKPGPIEQALIGTKVRNKDNPFEVVRIVRSFDPCIACAVHIVAPGDGTKLAELRII